MRKLLKYLRPYRTESVLGPLFKMLEALFELFIPLVVAAIVDDGIAKGDRAFIFSRAALMVLLGVVGLLASVTAQYFSAKAAVGMATDLRRALFAHVLALPEKEIDRMGAATLLSRVTADVNQVQTTVNMVLRLFLRSPFIVFGAMIMAFTVSPRAALTFVVTVPALSVVVFGVMFVSIPMFRRVQAALDRVLSLTRENLTGARVVRAFVRERASDEEFAGATGTLTRLQRFTGRFSALLNPLTYVILNLSVLTIIWLGGVQVSYGDLTQGEVIALYNYMSQILAELIKLANFIILITKACAGGARIEAVLETPAGMPRGETRQPATEAAGRVAFRHVSLCYHEGSAPALSDLTFEAKAGEIIGIIGGTGSGKSSLAALIPRFYDATEGEVLVDGVNVRDYPDVAALRRRIGYVPQHARLFSGTVRDNLAFGAPDGTDDAAMWEALDAAQAADFVKEKSGLDTPVEQNGRNLSGGQKQRLTIARALARRPEILILDDSASALDYATDAALRAALAALPYRPTVFLISQRTASLSRADRILVLEDGACVGCGTHAELLETCPVYREIHHSQFSPEEVSAT